MNIRRNVEDVMASRILQLHKQIPFLNWRTLTNEDPNIFPSGIDETEKSELLEHIKESFKALGIIDFFLEKNAITWMTEYGYKLRSLPRNH